VLEESGNTKEDASVLEEEIKKEWRGHGKALN